MYIPEQGDIVYLNFDPSAGREVMKRRPAFVISKRIFNQHTGFAVVAPITSTLRNMSMEVVLPDGMTTTGAIMVHQMKSLDFKDGGAERVESAPVSVTLKALGIVKAIIS